MLSVDHRASPASRSPMPSSGPAGVTTTRRSSGRVPTSKEPDEPTDRRSQTAAGASPAIDAHRHRSRAVEHECYPVAGSSGERANARLCPETGQRLLGQADPTFGVEPGHCPPLPQQARITAMQVGELAESGAGAGIVHPRTISLCYHLGREGRR